MTPIIKIRFARGLHAEARHCLVHTRTWPLASTPRRVKQRVSSFLTVFWEGCENLGLSPDSARIPALG